MREVHDDTTPERSRAISFRGVDYVSPKAFSTGTHRARDPSETIDLITPQLKRAGVTRIADITGLDNVGVPTTLAFRPNAMTMACSSGKGITPEQAYASGAMEAFELYAAETAILPSIQSSYYDLEGQYPLPPLDCLPLAAKSLFSPHWPLHWFIGWDLLSQAEVPVPLVTVGMSTSDALISSLGAFQVSSNGLGAGNSFLEAVAAGLYELIERDAIACRYSAALSTASPIPVFMDKQLRSFPLVARVLDRCDEAAVRILVHDCTVDTWVPTYEAIAYDIVDQGVGVVGGSGAHLDPEVALLRAITEALQGRLNFIAGSRDDIFRTAYRRFRADWPRAVAMIEHERQFGPPAGLANSRAASSFEEDIQSMLDQIRKVGIEHVVVVDLTPSDFPVHVVRVVVPGLEGYMHHSYRPGSRAARYATEVGQDAS